MEETLNAILQVLTEIRDENRDLRKRVSDLEKDTLLSASDSAKLLGISRMTLYRRTEKGLLKQQYIGGRKGYLLSDLNQIK